jgi:uncharacterized protein
MKLELWGEWQHEKSVRLTGLTKDLDIHSADVRFDETVTVDCTITSDLDIARVAGTVTVGAELDCARCMRQFRRAISGEFELVTQRLKLGENAPQLLMGEDIDEDETDMVFIPYGENTIDITQQVHDVLMLSVPVKPLHAEDCKGLCVVCGIDLNEETCCCGQNEPDGRWGALGNLKHGKS